MSGTEAGDEGGGSGGPGDSVLSYRLCPRCSRAVPAHSAERYCVNDGTRLLDACPVCGAAITSPYSRYCAGCGRSLAAPGV
jgi:Double zinc ribbon